MEEVFKTWYKPLQRLLETEYFSKLVKLLDTQYELSRFAFNKIKIYPEKKNVFKCFNCDFNKLKVVFIGSRPFDEFSEGLAFDSSIEKVNLHPTAEVIRSRIEEEFYNGFNLVHDFTMEYLMKQGVLLLNEALTTTNQKDHDDLWKEFTIGVIRAIQLQHTGIIFCIEKKSEMIDYIDTKSNYVIMYDDPKHYQYNPEHWGFNFQQINDILNHTNGKEYEIEF